MPHLKIQRPKVILFDLCGTVIKEFFIDRGLWPYIRDYIPTYLNENWNQPNVLLNLKYLRKAAAAEDSNAPQIPNNNDDKDTVIEATVAFVKYCIENKKESSGMTMLRFHMWFDAYRRQYIETPVFSDVAVQIQKWRCDLNIKLHVLSNGWEEATKRFLSQTTHGDLNLLIDGHHDTSLGPLTDPRTFLKVARKLNEPPCNILFLTKSSEEGQAAVRAGLNAVLCITHRATIAKLDEKGKKMPRVRTFNQIEFVD